MMIDSAFIQDPVAAADRGLPGIQDDQSQRILALDASQSFIVQAPAGSGKTELLIQRFLTLLRHVKKPEEILAITFTKKAANEMRLRVVKALKQAQSEPEPESSHARQTWRLASDVLHKDRQNNWNLIENPNQLRIQTIDSLCSFLTRQLPLLSHFGAQPDITLSPESLYEEAAQEALLAIEADNVWSQTIGKLLLHLDNDLNKLRKLLVDLLGKRDQWLDYIKFEDDTDIARNRLENDLAAVIADSLGNLVYVFPHDLINDVCACARYAAVNIPDTSSPVKACLDMTTLPGASHQDKNKWLGLAKILLTEDGGWRKAMDKRIGFPAESSFKNPQEKRQAAEFKQIMGQLLQKLAGRDSLRKELDELRQLPDSSYPDAQWDILQALLRLLKLTAAHLRVVFHQYGQIDFIENATAALEALGDEESPTDLALALDYQIRHILVDEFQDTSYSQYHLLKKLTNGWENDDGRTLFVVGDPMQSIYRFREAEVGLFIRMRQHGIGNVKLTPITLSMNFRSTSRIVEWNNTVFNQVFPAHDDIAKGAVSYSRSLANHTAMNDQTWVRVHGYSQDNEGDNRIADEIASLIKQTSEACPGESIALLVRARGHLSTIIPALKKHRITYRAVDIDPLESRQCIQDLLSLTCAMLHPADRISWLAVLRAPWCGLSLADLLRIAGGQPHKTVWERLEMPEVLQSLSADGRLRIDRMLPVLKGKLLERERHDLRFWVESTWLLLGGPACLRDDSDMDDAQAFFKLLEEFGANPLHMNIDRLKEKISELFASSHHDNAILQIMTIHTAKGLEFDTVILPHLEKKSTSDDKKLLLWIEQPLNNNSKAYLLAPMNATGAGSDSIYDYISHQQKVKADYETDRLLYVAATRAKKRLHLFYSTKTDDEQTPRGLSGSFLKKLWPVLEQENTSVEAVKPEQHGEVKEHEKRRHLSRLPAGWENPLREASFKRSAAHQQPSGFLVADITPRLTGVVIHKVLQLLSQHGSQWWHALEKHGQTEYLGMQFRQLGMNPAKMQANIALAAKAVANALDDTRGKWILHAHEHAVSEFALTAVLDGKAETLVLDRTFIDESGVRWIIDYKTALLAGHDLNDFLEREQEKYREKMHKYAKAMRAWDGDRPIKLGLYFPTVPAWQEWDA